jgi:hypothetical protein
MLQQFPGENRTAVRFISLRCHIHATEKVFLRYLAFASHPDNLALQDAYNTLRGCRRSDSLSVLRRSGRLSIRVFPILGKIHTQEYRDSP